MMRRLAVIALLLAIAERVWKLAAIARFFKRPLPAPPPGARPMVSIVQPILSGDPTLEASLEQSLTFRSSYPREWLWLVDDDDEEGRRVCQLLIARHQRARVRLLLVPPPSPTENPKTAKLIVGAKAARGAIFCVLDDDTRLPDDGLEQCLPFLDLPGVGLAFGLPFYVSFDNLWSALVAAFVNSNSLLTYVPAAMSGEPVTINGMFYATRRDVLASVGDFEGLESVVADDFAVARRFHERGYRLAQTPLRHGISTSSANLGHYGRLIQRWLVFPRESIMRHLPPGELARFYVFTLLPVFAPWLAVGAAARLKGLPRALGLAYLALDNGAIAALNHIYLGGATPARWAWLTPLVQLILPAQAIGALLAPQRITWRGHVIEVRPGGTIRTIQRREQAGT
jgi:ceramide glucosyltransferase